MVRMNAFNLHILYTVYFKDMYNFQRFPLLHKILLSHLEDDHT